MGQVTAKGLFEQANKLWEKFDINPILPALRGLNEGALEDVLNINGCRYYQWSPCLIEVLKPKQIVELGGAMGVWDLMVLNGKYQDFDLYSVTLPEQGLEFAYVVDKYSNFHPLVGDDLDLKVWYRAVHPPAQFNPGPFLEQTDLWFFDSSHTREQLQAELDMYTPYFKKGSVLLFDDIRLPELWPIWEKLPYDKYECTNPCHYSGYGLAIV